MEHQATADYVVAIQKLCAAGLAELAGLHFLQRAQVSRSLPSTALSWQPVKGSII